MSSEFIDSLLEKNRFDTQYRAQLEKTSAMGTVGAYIYLDRADYMMDSNNNVFVANGDIKINYCDGDCILPLTVENDIVKECAFSATNTVGSKEQTTLVIFTLENGNYKAETVVFDSDEKIISDGEEFVLGDIKPFAVMRNAEVNNIDNMVGYGLPKIYSAIPLFEAIDLCYSLLYGDLNKGDKMVFINELLSSIQEGADGKPRLTKQQQEVLILLGEKLPEQNELIHEYNPVIRIDEITKAFELVLSLISMMFGYGSKKYTFENGQIKTATEYIGEKQDEMQELNKQRKEATAYIKDIIRAAMWYSNRFKGTNYSLDEELSIEFDDSYVEDKQTKIESMRTDALSFPEIRILKVWYFKERYNLSDEEAEALVPKDNPIEDTIIEEE